MTPNLLLNGFEVELSSHAFTAQVRNMKTAKGLRRLREEHEGSWFLYWRGGKVYGVPKVPEPAQDFGEPVKLTFEDNSQLVAARMPTSCRRSSRNIVPSDPSGLRWQLS